MIAWQALVMNVGTLPLFHKIRFEFRIKLKRDSPLSLSVAYNDLYILGSLIQNLPVAVMRILLFLTKPTGIINWAKMVRKVIVMFPAVHIIFIQ